MSMLCPGCGIAEIDEGDWLCEDCFWRNEGVIQGETWMMQEQRHQEQQGQRYQAYQQRAARGDSQSAGAGEEVSE